MRVLYVWLTAIIAIFVLTVGWLIGNGVVTAIVSQTFGDITGQGLSLAMLIEFVAAWWGPLLDLVVLAWAFLHSQETDITSRLLGGG